MNSTPLSPFGLMPPDPSIEGAMAIYFILLRIAFFVAFVVYGLFSVVVVRQVYLMDQTIKTPLAPILKLVAWAHLFIAIGSLILVFVAL